MSIRIDRNTQRVRGTRKVVKFKRIEHLTNKPVDDSMKDNVNLDDFYNDLSEKYSDIAKHLNKNKIIEKDKTVLGAIKSFFNPTAIHKK